jgi:Lrp/AsnC family leucine-responsive transcriptional regulator
MAKPPGRRPKIAQREDAPPLDAIDRRILHELQNDGRLTNLELAERIGLSPSPCLRRMKRLEEEGVLSRYVALVDPGLVGLEVTVFTRVSLSSQGDAQLARFEKAAASWPEVMECYLMSGDADYQLRVVVPSLAAYEIFLRQRLTPVPGIAKIQSSFAFRPVIYRTELPIP